MKFNFLESPLYACMHGNRVSTSFAYIALTNLMWAKEYMYVVRIEIPDRRASQPTGNARTDKRAQKG